MVQIFSDDPRQLRLQFDSEREREEFEQWLKMGLTLNWTTSSNPSPSIISGDSSPILKRVLLSDQKLSQLEQEKESVRADRQLREQRHLKNREGVLPWTTQPPSSPRS